MRQSAATYFCQSVSFTLCSFLFFFSSLIDNKMDKKNNSKKQHSKKMVESGVSSKKTGKGNKVKVKKYWTVDHMQSCFYDLPEGLKVRLNRSGKAIYWTEIPQTWIRHTRTSTSSTVNLLLRSTSSRLTWSLVLKGPKLAHVARQRW